MTIFTNYFSDKNITHLLILIKFNYSLQKWSWVLLITDCSNLLALEKMKQINVSFLDLRLPRKVLMALIKT